MYFYKTNQWCTDPNSPSFTEEQWEKWGNEYAAYFETIADKLPKALLKQYYVNKGFHDFIISKIYVENKNSNKINIEIELNSNYSGGKNINKKIILTYQGIESYSIIVPHNKNWTFNNMQWLTSEFYFYENGLWSHRIMCDGNCELKIKFKKIRIRK